VTAPPRKAVFARSLLAAMALGMTGAGPFLAGTAPEPRRRPGPPEPFGRPLPRFPEREPYKPPPPPPGDAARLAAAEAKRARKAAKRLKERLP